MKDSKLCNWRNIVASLSITLMLFSATNLFAQGQGQGQGQGQTQSSEKFSTSGNILNITDFLGSRNAMALSFKTNNIERMTLQPNGYFGFGVEPLSPFHINGEVRLNSLNGTVNGIVIADKYGILNRISLTGDNHQVLLGNGTFAEYWDNDWMVEGDNMYSLINGGIAIGASTFNSDYKLEVTGNTKVNGIFYVGENIKINGLTNEINANNGKLNFGTTNLFTEGFIQSDNIYSLNGTINFGNSNLTTTGNINANNITFNGIPTFENLNVTELITTKNLAATESIETENTLRFTGGDASIIGSADVNINAEGNINLNTIGNINITEGKLGIGVQPIEKLDVDGNCNIRGYLYVQDGVIIGQRIESQRMQSDTINAQEVINTKELHVEELISTGRIEINEARTQTINIDGINSKITSTTGNINFDNENLTTSGGINTANISTGTLTATSDINCDGTITAANINAQNMTINTASYNKLQVNNSLTVGTNTMILSSEQGETTVENKISTDGGDLKIQCESISIPARNTLINTGNNGNVGIGTLYPMKKLHVKTSELSEVIGVGEFGGTIRLEHELQGITSSVWDISPTAVTSTGYLNRLDFIAPEESAIPILSLVKNGKVGVGTTAPKEQLEVTGAIKIGTTENINPGTIRFKNNEFEGNTNGTADGWKSLTDNGVWTKVGTTNNIEYTAGNVTIGSGSTGGLTVKGIKAATGTTQMVTVDENGVFNKENIPSMADICDAITCGDNEVAINKKLTVNGNVSFVNSANFNYSFQIGNTIPKRRGISIDDDPNGTVNFWIHEWQNNSAFNFMLNKNADGTNTSKLMTINENGNVAIGNPTTIDAKLHVAGDVKIDDLADGSTTRMVVADADGKLGFQDIATNTDGSGNVGIGTTAPLQINPNASLFAGATPKLEILTGAGNSPYSELITIRHNPPDNAPANLRQLGLVFKLSNEYIGDWDESLKMGGIMLESKEAWSGHPSLFLLTNNQKQVELTNGGDLKLLNGKLAIGNPSTIDAKLHVAGDVKIDVLEDKSADYSPLMLVKGDNGILGTMPLPSLCSSIKCNSGKVGIGVANASDISADLHIYKKDTDPKIRLEKNTTIPAHEETVTDNEGDPIGTTWVEETIEASNWDISNEGDNLSFNKDNNKISFSKDGGIVIGITNWKIKPLGNFLFFSNNISSNYNPICFTANGNIGIGEAFPLKKLVVKGTDDNSSNLIPTFINNSTGASGIRFENASGFWTINFTGTSNYQGAGKLNLHCDSVDIMTLQKNGNVGIGTTSPSAKLDVIGDLSISSDAKIVGNLLIGTATVPKELKVNGTIWSNEVKIRTNTWSDFVFKPNYDLMPLSELENFIQKNNHLPNIPSEKEILENGNDLGKTDALLLQKIEELTLYLLQLKNENQELKNRVDCLENK